MKRSLMYSHVVLVVIFMLVGLVILGHLLVKLGIKIHVRRIHQDKADDLLVGVKSSALKLGDSTRPWLFAFYAPVVVLLAVAGLSASLAWPYFVALAAAAIHLGWQAKTVDLDRPSDCLAKFKSNRDFGLIVLIGIVAGQVVG